MTIQPKNVAGEFREKVAQGAGKSLDAFYDVFDPSPDQKTSLCRGQWDFALHVATPLAPYLQQPEHKTALEIGYGGGRVLAAGSRYFAHVYGVDIHSQAHLVQQELQALGLRNFELKTGQGNVLPVSDQSVDVVYSFIVLQHLGKIEIFDSYVKESFRALKPGGVAVLYFGRYCRFSFNHGSWLRLLLDRAAQYLAMPKGYREIAVASPTDNSLLITQKRALASMRTAGFEVLGTGISRRKVPDGVNLFGGQYSAILRKPL